MAESYITRKGGGGGAEINADIIPYEVAPGQTVAAGDMVSFGYDKVKFALSQPSLLQANLVVTLGIEKITDTTYLVFYSKGTSAGALTIATLNADDTVSFGSEVLLSDTGAINVVRSNLSKWNSTKFLVGYVLNSDNFTRAAVVTISGSTISVGPSYITNNQAVSTAHQVVAMANNPALALSAFGSSTEMRVAMLTVSGNVITTSNSQTVHTGGSVGDILIKMAGQENFVLAYTIGGTAYTNVGYISSSLNNDSSGTYFIVSKPGSSLFVSAPIVFMDLVELDANNFLLLSSNNTNDQPNLFASLIRINGNASWSTYLPLGSSNGGTLGTTKFSAKAVKLNNDKIFITYQEYPGNGYRNTNYILNYDKVAGAGALTIHSVDYTNFPSQYWVAGMFNFSIVKVNENKILQIGRIQLVNNTDGTAVVHNITQKIYNTPTDYVLDYIGTNPYFTPIVLATQWTRLVQINATKFLLLFMSGIDYRLSARILEFNPTTKIITHGAAVLVQSTGQFASSVNAVVLDENTVIAFFNQSGLKGRRLSISGNTITTQTEIAISSNQAREGGIGCVKLSSTTAAIVHNHTNSTTVEAFFVQLSGSTSLTAATRSGDWTQSGQNGLWTSLTEIIPGKYLLGYHLNNVGIVFKVVLLGSDGTFNSSANFFTLPTTSTDFINFSRPNQGAFYDVVVFNENTLGIVHRNTGLFSYTNAILTVLTINASNNLTASRAVVLAERAIHNIKTIKVSGNKILIGFNEGQSAQGEGNRTVFGLFDINYTNFPIINYEKEFLDYTRNLSENFNLSYFFKVNDTVLYTNANTGKAGSNDQQLEFTLLSKSTKLNKTRGNGVAKSAGTAGQVIDVYTK
jgi:hypothetical protein